MWNQSKIQLNIVLVFAVQENLHLFYSIPLEEQQEVLRTIHTFACEYLDCYISNHQEVQTLLNIVWFLKFIYLIWTHIHIKQLMCSNNEHFPLYVTSNYSF